MRRKKEEERCGALYSHVCGAQHFCEEPEDHEGEHECMCGFTWEDDDIDNNEVEF
jgi:hypothetical protein